MEAIVVPCTKEKVWDTNPSEGAVAAKDAYTNQAFLRWRKYAEDSGHPWFILSTKYGLISPDHLIENYSVPVSVAKKDSALLEHLKEQGREHGLQEFDKIVLLDWEKFRPLVRAAIPDPRARCVLRKLIY